MDVFHLVGSTGSNRNTCWSLARMREMEQGLLPGACKFPGGTNHSGAPASEGEPCWQSFSSWVYPSLLFLPCYLSLLHTGASHHPNSFFPVAGALEWFIETGLSQSPLAAPKSLMRLIPLFTHQSASTSKAPARLTQLLGAATPMSL